jgi:ABC-type Fe3+-hydroxamate transport system substrate-binding protein
LNIVSLEPSVTAMLFAVGAQEQLVAVSEYCHRLVNIGQRPQLAPTWSAQEDELANLAPDLVIVAPPYRAESIAALLQTGLNLFCLYPRQLSDLYQHLIWLGGLTGRAAKAREVVTQTLRPSESKSKPLPLNTARAFMWRCGPSP